MTTLTGLRLQDYGYRFFPIGTETYLCDGSEVKEGSDRWVLDNYLIPVKIVFYPEKCKGNIIATTDKQLISEGICKIEIPDEAEKRLSIATKDHRWDILGYDKKSFLHGYRANPAKWTDEDMIGLIDFIGAMPSSNFVQLPSDRILKAYKASLQKVIDWEKTEWEVEEGINSFEQPHSQYYYTGKYRIKGLDSGVITPNKTVYK